MNKKVLILSAIMFFVFLMPGVALAEDALPTATSSWGILPSTNKTYENCITELAKSPPNNSTEVLACAIKTGRVHLSMLPYFVGYIIKFLLGIAGLISVLFMVYGGYQWVVAGISEKQDAAKKTIWHALIGFVVVLVSFAVVSLVQTIVTG